MEFSRNQRRLFLGLFLFLATLLGLRIVSPQYLFAQIAQSVANPSQSNSSSGSNAAQGQKVGNNLAIQFPQAGDNFSEAGYTMAILSERSDEDVIVNQINNSSGTVVIRFGVGEAPMPANEFGNMLVRMSGKVNKPFVATANGNESNCNEDRPLADEVEFARTVAGIAGNDPKITLITGQIDYYCDPSVARSRRDGGTPEQYRDRLLAIPGIKGLAVPLYTGVAGDVNATVALLNNFIKNVSVDVYITESGPLRGNFKDFVLALQQASTNPKVKAILLFDSHGLNPEFVFTKPFWNPACREALRTILGETDKVVAICEGETSTSVYFEYNIQRASTQKVLNNLYDEYSVACMPKEDYKLVKNNHDKCALIGKCNNWNVPGDITFNPAGKMFGLFRNESSVESRDSTIYAKRTESIEAYLGTRNPDQTSAISSDPAAPPARLTGSADLSITQSPLLKLTSFKQQCTFALNKLIAVKQLCQNNRIEGDVEKLAKAADGSTNSNTCAIDTAIPGHPGITHLNLLAQVLSSADPTAVVDTCEKITNVDSNDQQAKKLRDTILAVPLTMEMAYRPAFIVAVTKFEGKDKQATQNVSFYSADTIPNGTPAGDYYVVDYLEVKVPAFGSDFVDPTQAADATNKTANYQIRNLFKDPLQWTADILQIPKRKELAEEKETTERLAIRNTAASSFQKTPTTLSNDLGGSIIGGNQSKIYCYKNGTLQECTPDGDTNTKYDPAKDAIPPALVAFINSAAPTQTNGMCTETEEDFYDPANKKKIAEQVKQIGSILDAQDVGDVKKKKDLKVPFNVHIQDVREGGDINNSTQLYFVSPHNYDLAYARDSFKTFLTKDQQNKLEGTDLASLSQTDEESKDVILSPEKFSPLLKSPSGENFNGGRISQSGPISDSLSATNDPNAPTDPNQNRATLTVNLAIEQPKDSKGKPPLHPLFWQVAGQVSSLPTRLMALVTTPFSHSLNQYTRGCTGDYATENWLLGTCKKKDDVKTPVCKPEGGTGGITVCRNSGGVCISCADNDVACAASANPSGSGDVAMISDGIVKLANTVSAETCMPAEILVAVLAKESNGRTYESYDYTGTSQDNNPGPAEPLTGDPFQLSIGRGIQMNCKNLDPNNPSSARYNNPCGAYQYSQGNIDAQLATYGAAITGCLQKLGVDKDTRKVGTSMCVAAANMWRSTYCNQYSRKYGRGCPFAYRSTTYGCGGTGVTGAIEKKAYSMEDLRALGFNDDDFALGINAFHGSSTDGAINNYLDYIPQYKPKVDALRGELTQCVGSGDSTGAASTTETP
jgi:hypothetical protein